MRKSSYVVKKNHGKYAEPPFSTSHAAGSKDSKPHDKENLKQKVEQEKEHDSQPNIALHRSVMASSATVEQQVPQTRKALKNPSSLTDLPDFTWAKGNLRVRIFSFDYMKCEN